jgi:hypothetical protein
MIDEGPPEKKAAGKGANPTRRCKTETTGLIPEASAFGNSRIVRVRYCLEPDTWTWLEWEAASRTGGWLP